MIRRWLVYLALLIGCLILFFAYQGWLAWLLLMALLWMPLLSLLVSLPAMLSTRLQIRCAATLPAGSRSCVRGRADGILPVPLYRFRIRVERRLTGESWHLEDGDALPTEHCGQLVCTAEKCWVYDYLCLFRIRIRRCTGAAAIVEPVPVMQSVPGQLEQLVSHGWRPKPGGGFSENHELRLYRPGDMLNQLHWKLSAKTGKLIIREAMEPLNKRLVLTLVLRGTPAQLDERLGKLLWLGEYLLRDDRGFELRVLSGEGPLTLQVSEKKSFAVAMRRILCTTPAARDMVLPPVSGALHFHIGGGTDEA